jgi:outer membrane immunogenic protein
MKKLFLLAAFSVVCATASFAQIRIGGFLANGTDIERWGVGANAEFFINEKMAIQPNLTLFFPESAGDYKFGFWELNADFHYYFLSQDVVSLYGKGGLNYFTATVKYDGPSTGFDISGSDSEVGLNLGIGANFNVGSILPFAELKFTLGAAEQAVLAVGIKFPIKE